MVYLVPVVIIFQGAALAGLGLALATWISRGGRAAAWTISALVASVVCWPIAGSVLFSRAGNMTWQNAAAMGSPFWNAGFTTAVLERFARGNAFGGQMEAGVVGGLVFWSLAYAAIALGLYLATLATFERCLGRTPERPDAWRPSPAPKRLVGQAVALSKAGVGEFDEWEVDGRLVP
jgi:hypothetical protein